MTEATAQGMLSLGQQGVKRADASCTWCESESNALKAVRLSGDPAKLGWWLYDPELTH